MSRFETIQFETLDKIGILTLNRPDSLNAVNDLMRQELEAFWADRIADYDIRVIIMTAAGEKGFCAGLDIKEAFSEFGNLDVTAFYRAQWRMSRILTAMRKAPQPIIAAVFGSAVGIGMSLALASDLRVISPDTRFAASYINIGFGGADIGSSYFLPRLIGSGRAYEFLLTGDFMDAPTAERLGMISRLVDRDALMDEALALAQNMCSKNPLGLRLTKEAINVNLDAGGLEQALNLEDRNQSMCFATLRHEGYVPGA